MTRQLSPNPADGDTGSPVVRDNTGNRPREVGGEEPITAQSTRRSIKSSEGGSYRHTVPVADQPQSYSEGIRLQMRRKGGSGNTAVSFRGECVAAAKDAFEDRLRRASVTLARMLGKRGDRPGKHKLT